MCKKWKGSWKKVSMISKHTIPSNYQKLTRQIVFFNIPTNTYRVQTLERSSNLSSFTKQYLGYIRTLATTCSTYWTDDPVNVYLLDHNYTILRKFLRLPLASPSADNSHLWEWKQVVLIIIIIIRIMRIFGSCLILFAVAVSIIKVKSCDRKTKLQ